MPPAETPFRARGSSRHVPRWLWISAGVLLSVRVATGVDEALRGAGGPERVEWQPLASAGAAVVESGRPILYDFSSDGSEECRRMRRELFADERSAALINQQFVPVRVLDQERGGGKNPPEVKELMTRFQVREVPTLVVAPADGRDPVRITRYEGRDQTLKKLLGAGLTVRMRMEGHDTRRDSLMRRIGIH